jgi:hypothetical protein
MVSQKEGCGSPASNEFFGAQSDVAGDHPDQRWGDVAPGVVGDGCRTTVVMPELLVRATLPDFDEAQA